MNVFNFDINYKFNDKVDRIIVLGKFKTMHTGHQKLFDAAIQNKGHKKLIAMIYPDFDGFSQTKTDVVIPQEDRIKHLEQMGFEDVMLFEPNSNNFDITSDQFVSFLKNNLNIKTVVIGEDFEFGKGKQSDATLLKEYFETIVVDILKYDGIKISSEWIIELIQNGDIKIANAILGYNFYYSGKVRRGSGRGKELGSPTANIHTQEGTVKIGKGIYISQSELDNKQYRSLTSNSMNPQFHGTVIQNETWLYEQLLPDFYGEVIKVELLDFIRKPETFANVEMLKLKINEDKRKAIKYFNLV